MTVNPLADPKWTLPEGTLLAKMMREAIFAAIQKNLDELGPDAKWSELVNDPTMPLLGAEDCRRIAARVTSEFQQIEGRKLYAGCEIAVKEFPDLYVLRSEVEVLEPREDWPDGVLGDGDNAFQADTDLEGEVLVIREVAEVDRLMREGVPEGTIAVIDDAGGTMTAPILEDFDGVVCLAGTVRSHLSIIAREMSVPTLMGVRLRRPLRNGERVRVQYSAKGQNVDAYFGGEVEPRAEIYAAGDDR
jgi:phosphohistidine swiveling domain-containing protein